MAKETKITFSKEHTTKSNPQKYTDVNRRNSDSSKTQKIGHSFPGDGYNSTSVNIPVKKN